MTDKQLYSSWKHQLGSYLFVKNKKYLQWLKGRYPGLDIHHLLKTVMGKKKATDYMVYPFEHEQHLGEIHSNIPVAFSKYYKASMTLLLMYRNELAEDNQAANERFIHYSPEEFINLTKEIEVLS